MYELHYSYQYIMKFKVPNDVRSLKDVEIPENCTELDCSYTKITSLEHCPPTLQQLSCNNTQITSLEHLPPFSQLKSVTGFTEDELEKQKKLVNTVFKMQIKWRIKLMLRGNPNHSYGIKWMFKCIDDYQYVLKAKS